MSYTEYLRRKEAAAPKVIDTTLRLDASSYTQRLKFAASRMINEANLKEIDQVDVPTTVSTFINPSLNAIEGIVIDSMGVNMYFTSYYSVRRVVMSTGQVTIIAGGSNVGYLDAVGTNALFDILHGICIDKEGNNLYVVDRGNFKIRKIELTGANPGNVTTVAGTTQGSTDGLVGVAQFNTPRGICIDSQGNNLYVADRDISRIRKVELTGANIGRVSTVSNNNTLSPEDITIDSLDSNLYTVSFFRHIIHKTVISSGAVSTVAGIDNSSGYIDAIGTAAQFEFPGSIVIDSNNSNLYVKDGSSVSKIRKIVISTGQVTTIAGGIQEGFLDGPASIARFNVLAAIELDRTGLNIYASDKNNGRIRKVALAYTFYPPIIPLNKTKSGGRIPDASTFTQYAGGQAVGKEIQAGMPAPRLLLNSTSTGSLSGCRIVPEPVPYNPAVAGAYTANMVPRDASQFTRDTTACRQLRGEPHIQIELGPPLFVDNTIVGIKNYNLPQNNSKTYIASECTQCGNNAPGIGKTCTFCIGANHLHPIDQAHNTRWGPRPKKSAQPIIVNQSPSDFHKVGAAMRKIPYVEKHHANPQIGHIVYPKTPYRIPRGTAAQLKINDPQRYPGTM